MSIECVMRWRLLLEEYNPTLKYIKGEKNTMADCISRAATVHDCPTETSAVEFEEILALTPEIKEVRFPMDTGRVRTEQQLELKADRKFRLHCRASRDWGYKMVHDTEILFHKGRIYVPKALRHEVLTWYHHFLCHPGATRLEKTIAQTMTWPKLPTECKAFVRVCAVCQCAKKGTIKYGHLPAKHAEYTPWDKLCVDIIGPYTITLDKKKALC